MGLDLAVLDGSMQYVVAAALALRHWIAIGCVVAVAALLIMLRAQRMCARRRISLLWLAPAAVLFLTIATATTGPALADAALFPYAAAGLAVGVSLGLFATGTAEMRHEVKGFWHKTDPYVSAIVLLIFVAFLFLRLTRLGLWSGAPGDGRGFHLPSIDWSPGIVLLRTAWMVFFATYASGVVCRAIGLKPDQS